LVSRCHEESKVIASRIETQFSEITIQQPIDEQAMLSFLNDGVTDEDFIRSHFESNGVGLEIAK